jgi:hypothetical protein
MGAAAHRVEPVACTGLPQPLPAAYAVQFRSREHQLCTPRFTPSSLLALLFSCSGLYTRKYVITAVASSFGPW